MLHVLFTRIYHVYMYYLLVFIHVYMYYLPVFIHVYMYYIPLFIHMYMYYLPVFIHNHVHVLFTSICTADHIFNMEILHVNHHRRNNMIYCMCTMYPFCFNDHQWTNLKLGELIIQTFFKTFNNFQYLILFILDQDGKIMKS